MAHEPFAKGEMRDIMATEVVLTAPRTWDARPYPFFPELTGIWTDGPNWRLGHWLTGRLGAVSLAALMRHLLARWAR